MKLLVTGASGYIGGYLVRAFESVEGMEVVSVRVDLADADGVHRHVEHVRPDVIVNCAAVSAPRICQEAGFDAIAKVNAPAHLADAAAAVDALLIQCSTDQVYDGTSPPYAPEPASAVNPVNVYGASKAAFDKVLEMHPRCRSVTLRLSNVFGPPVNGLTKFLQWVAGRVEAATAADPVCLFADEKRSFVYLDDVYAVVRRVCEQRDELCPKGAARSIVYNLGGPESLSRCDFGRAVAARIAADDGRVTGEPRPKDLAVPTPLDITMNSTATFEALGLKQTPIAEALKAIYPDGGKL